MSFMNIKLYVPNELCQLVLYIDENICLFVEKTNNNNKYIVVVQDPRDKEKEIQETINK